MIYDPNDVKIAMDEHGVLYHATPHTNEAGESDPQWVPVRVMDFRRPEW
jgi:hypothetical protein